MGRKYLQSFYVLALIISALFFPAFSGDNNIKTAGANMSYGNRLVMQTGHKSANLVSGVEKVEWMKVLQDTLPVCKISIPGTHDSGSTKGGCMLKTQTADIPAQLQKGIRAFDIRLKEKNGKLGVFHSHAFQDIYWEEDVLLAFISFLQAHPSETLIVSLKKEGGEIKDYASLLSASLNTPAYQRYFIADFHPELTLKSCRGKILFLHRDHAMDNYPGAACIGWDDNTTCLLTLRNKDGKEAIKNVSFKVEKNQALFELRQSIKSEGILVSLLVRKSCDGAGYEIVSGHRRKEAFSRRWGISFVSATGLHSGIPLVFANKVNKPVADYLKENRKRNCGIVFIDFIESSGGQKLVEYLIGGNIY